MTAKAETDPMLVAVETGTFEGFVIRKGVTHLRSGHPLAKARPELFKRAKRTRPEVEQATAAPSEKRAGRSRAKRQ